MTFWEILSAPILLLWTMLTKLWIPTKNLMDSHPIFKLLGIAGSISAGIGILITWLNRRR